MIFETGAEELAYEKGWAHAKEVFEFDVRDDRERIVKILNAKMTHDFAYWGDSSGVERSHSQFCRLCEIVQLVNTPREENK
jgi:hypothetical protein